MDNSILRLMSREISQHWKRYLLCSISFVSLFVLFIIYGVVNKTLVIDEFSIYCLYLLGLYIFGYFLANQSFKDLHSKKTGLAFLLLPASVMKKFLSIVLINSLGFAIVYSVVFVLIKWVVNIWLLSGFSGIIHIGILPYQVSVVINALLLFLPIQALFYYGSISFKNYSFLKTLLCLSLIFLSIMIFRYFVSNFILEGIDYKGSLYLTKQTLMNGRKVYGKYGGTGLFGIWGYITVNVCLPTIVLYFIAFSKFKTKEIS